MLFGNVFKLKEKSKTNQKSVARMLDPNQQEEKNEIEP